MFTPLRFLVSKLLLALPLKHKFSIIYHLNLFGKSTSKSGPGSSLEATKEIREALPMLIKNYRIKSLLDVPCGDAFWISTLFTTFKDYTGIDIVPALVSKNRARFPGINFIEFNAIESVPSKVDLIICRDFLVHLNLEQAKRVMENFKASKSTYLLITNFPKTSINVDLSGIWRPLNLELEPFEIPNILERINENCLEGAGSFKDKELILLKMN